MNTKKCFKCGYTWIPRTENPISCPNCKSRTWATNREGEMNEKNNGNTQT